MQLPRWIPEEEWCSWCKKYTMEPFLIDDDNNDLIVHYHCKCSICRCLKALDMPAYFAYKYTGGKAVKLYEKFKENLSKEPALSIDEKVCHIDTDSEQSE